MKKSIKKPIEKGVAKVPMVMQLEALECGAACLDMILAYYDKWIPLEKVRMDCGVSRDGSKAKNVLFAARSYGFNAHGFKFEPEQLMENGKFPCIIHWNFNHFVVLCGFKGNKAYINDPARGLCTVSMEEFDQSFTGVCLMMEPGENFTPSGKPKSMFDFAKKRLAGSIPSVVFVAIISIISAIIGIFDPILLRVFADYLLVGKNLDWLYPFIYTMAGFSALLIVVGIIKTFITLRVGGKMAVVGNATYMWKVFHLPMNFFSQRVAGDILSRKTAQSEVTHSLVYTVAPLIIDFFMMIFYLVIMIRYSLVLTIIGLLSIIIDAILSRIISTKRVNITRVAMRDESKLVGSTVSGIEMIETIKSSGAENGYFEKWSGFQASVNNQDGKALKLDAYFGLIPAFVSELCSVLILGIGVYLTFSGQLTVGMVMAFQGFFTSFAAPAESLVGASQTIIEMRTQAERIEDIMDYPEDNTFQEEGKEGVEYSKLSGKIEIKDITFGYSPLEEPLIKNFSLDVKPGSRIALVGMSGCGKSTISKLVSGLYKPWSGTILFDGKPMSEIDKQVFTGSLAVVDQDIVLFEDTIENNIKLWDSSIEDFEMILAARDAQIHEDIVQREGGYKHKINEGGKDFSGGQRQRLEIARVLAQDPSIVILDEATSALDARTEYDVVNAIKDRGITCIVVAHRLSTIRDCDEILVMDHGQVIERGTHEELMAQKGQYVQLVSSN